MMYSINTGNIFQDLLMHFKKFDRSFLINEVQQAYKLIAKLKSTTKIEFNGTNNLYLKNYEDIRYPTALHKAENIENFPFPDFTLIVNKQSEYFSIVDFDVSNEININENNFDLFFALKMFLTDIMEVENFLEYHFENSFNTNFLSYQLYLENVCIKYNEFLHDKFSLLVTRFINKHISDIQIDKTNNKEFTTARQVLAITYLLNELQINRSTTSLTEIARFIQFLNGKETGVAKINDTTIYKRVKQPFSIADKAAESDLQFIRTYFEKLGLQTIVNRINKEIGSKEKK